MGGRLQRESVAGMDWNTHATVAISEFYDNFGMLDEVDWNIMELRYWNDTRDYPDRKRKRQAEFLIKDSCPWTLINEIGVMRARLISHVLDKLSNTSHKPAVNVHHEWYY